MNETLEQYKQSISELEELIEFHPEYLDKIDANDRTMLSQYYFAGRRVNVDDLEKYRDELLAQDPSLLSRALSALSRFKSQNKI